MYVTQYLKYFMNYGYACVLFNIARFNKPTSLQNWPVFQSILAIC